MNISSHLVGKYELQERLGRGGMGEVWKGFDTQLRRHVAIKFLRTDLQDDSVLMTRFRREAQVVASLRHPNIVQIYDAHLPLPTEREEGLAYMVMDYVPGWTLTDYIRSTSRMGKFPPGADLVRLFTPISLAIDYAHQHGLIHRDIKPANILLDARNTAQNPMGEPLLNDFGLVKSLGAPTGALTHASIGTPLYLSPEQAQGHSGNERSDIYSLGVILYELVTGVTPFQGNNPFEIMIHHVKTLPPPPTLLNATIPPAVNEGILRSLAKDPAHRFSSASSMTAALAEALRLPVPEEFSPPAYPTDPLQRPTSYTTIPSPSARSPFLEAPGSPSALFVHGPFPKASVPLPSRAAPPAQSPLPSGTPPPTQPPSRGKRLGWLPVSVIVLLIIGLVGSGLGALFVFHPWGSIVPSASIVGQAVFVSSGQLDLRQANSPGLNDEMQIDLQNVPAPTVGNAYYAWLVKDNEEGTILLGKLAVNAGHVHFVYPGDAEHTNLLAITNSLLIAEEDANRTPGHPSFNKQLYHAELSQQPDPVDPHHFSVLDHLRHLLSGEQTLDALGVHGGLDVWLLRNTAKVDGWAGIARDYWDGPNTNASFLHGQIVHMLDVLEGRQVDPRDAPLARIALIDTPHQDPPDYLDHTINHLDALTRSPGAPRAQRALAQHIETSLEGVRAQLEQVQQDAQQLVTMTDQQMAQQKALSLLNAMATAASDAYLGQFDPSTGILWQEGIVQLASAIQHLAMFDVTFSQR